MKKITLYLLILLTTLVSCVKENQTNTNTQYGEEQEDDLNDYYYGGVLPEVGSSNTLTLGGTKWLIVRYKTNTLETWNYVNDTIIFTSNNIYQHKPSNGTVYSSKSYILGIIPNSGNYSLSFNNLFLFGANQYTSVISSIAIQEGVINNALFKHSTDASKPEYLVDMVKL
jgi:hypothetical protein